MTLKEKIQEQLDRGFTKKDLEAIVGLPVNSLSGFMADNRRFSKKNTLRLERWIASENKPDPLEMEKVKKQVLENNKPGNKERVLKERAVKPNEPNPVTQLPLTEKECYIGENPELAALKHKGGPPSGRNISKEIELANKVPAGVPPMPVKKVGEDAFDFAARKNEWKKLYQK